jgi:hypothetical protein
MHPFYCANCFQEIILENNNEGYHNEVLSQILGAGQVVRLKLVGLHLARHGPGRVVEELKRFSFRIQFVCSFVINRF